MARASASSDSALSGVFFLQPLAMDAGVFYIECSVQSGGFKVRSNDVNDAEVAVHCSGSLGSAVIWHRTNLASMRAISCTGTTHVAALYNGFDSVGLQYGPGYRTLVEAWGGANEGLARLCTRAAHEGTVVHPADLDDALCASALIRTSDSSDGGETRLPFAVDDALLQDGARTLWAAVSLQGIDAVAVHLGAVVGPSQAQLNGFKSRALRAEAPTKDHMYATEWRSIELTKKAPSVAIVVAGDAGVSAGAALVGGVGVSLRVRALVMSVPHGRLAAQPVFVLEASFALVQAQAAGVVRALSVWLLTRGTEMSPAGLWGLARSALAEAPLPLCCVDASAAMVIARGSSLTEPEALLLKGNTFVPRLAQASVLCERVIDSAAWGAHVVTGGTSGIGLLTARWLAQHGAHALALASRSGALACSTTVEWAQMEGALAAATLVQRCDVAEASHVHRLLSSAIRGAMAAGIWHAAGTLSDGVLPAQGAASLTAVFAPKAHSGLALHAASASSGLRTYALFSSVAALFGGAGQANYSAANACLDTLASYRRGAALRGVSVQWGAWAELGMAARGSTQMAAREAASGFARIGLAQGLMHLSSAVRHGAPPVVGVVPVTWSRFLVGAMSTPAFLSAFAPAHRVAAGCKAAAGGGAVSLDAVLETVQLTAGGRVDADAPLMEAGLDSLGAIELRNQLQHAAGDGTVLSTTLMFDYPTARQIALHLQGNRTDGGVVSIGGEQTLGIAHSEVGVTSQSFALPVGVSNDAAVCQVSHCGCDLLSEIPLSRWDVAEAARDAKRFPPEVASRVRHGAFLHDAQLFENHFFAVSVAEASAMDPQQRQLLERGYAALHGAGMVRETLLGSLIAVNVGQWASEFEKVLTDNRGVYASTGFQCSVTCGRVSFVLGLHGSCASIDTACSSTLVAQHSSMRALQRLECTSAVSAGVNMMFHADATLGDAIAGLTSAQGRSHTFDVRADGYARGEAVVAFASSLGSGSSTARLLGSAVRQDGRSASLTAPNGQAQQMVLLASLADGCCDAGHVAMLEAHGTGTALGDPIEAGSIGAVYLMDRREGTDTWLDVGSMKANAGHTEPCAGLVGAVKLLLQMRCFSLSPNAQLRSLNPLVDAKLRGCGVCALATQVGCVLLSETGALSSFGYSGTIAHASMRMHHMGSTKEGWVAPLVYRQRAYPWRVMIHPFAQQRVQSMEGGEIFRSATTGALQAVVADHVVRGRVIFPGAGCLEMARASASSGSVLCGVFFLQPLVVEAPTLFIECRVIDGLFQVRSGTGSVLEDTTVHCSGALAAHATWPLANHAWERAHSRAADVGALYDTFCAAELHYGPAFRVLAHAWAWNGTRCLARLTRRTDWQGTHVHPADLDGALQLGAIMPTGYSETQLPFAVDVTALRGVGVLAKADTWATVVQQSDKASLVTMAEMSGRTSASLDGFKSRALKTTVLLPKERRWHYEIEWMCAVHDGDDDAPSVLELLVIGNEPPGLSSHGHVHVRGGEGMLAGGRWDAVLFMSSLRLDGAVRVDELQAVESALRLVQLHMLLNVSPPVWLCTTATQPISQTSSYRHAGLWGLARTCRQERATLPLWCVDVHDDEYRVMDTVIRKRPLRLPSGSVRGLRLSPSIEPEVALRAATLHVPRLVAPYDTHPTALDVTFAMVCRLLDAHTVKAMAALDTEPLLRAYALLEALCQQYLSEAIHAVHEAKVPVWHHKLLHAWCAKQLPTSPSDLAIAPVDVRAAHADLWAEVQLAERCGPLLAQVLLSAVGYQQVLFPGGSVEVVQPVYEHAISNAFYNGCVVAAVEVVLSLRAAGQRVVALEVGAGSGGTASSILPVLESACERFVFTDVSNVFIRQAQARFANFPFIEYALLNIDADPRLQGFALRQYDFIIATNVLHATPFVRNALQNCGRLSRAGGVFVVNEALTTDAFTQMTFGMTDGWWLFREGNGPDPDRVGQDSPLLGWRQWEALLADCGFYRSHCLQGGSFLQGQAVIVAQIAAPGKASPVAGSDGTHFISGGTGGLGLLTARLLVEEGWSQLVLSSRSDRVVTGSESDWAWLAESGATVLRICCDASDDGDVCAVVRGLCGEGRRICGIFHTAHQLADAAIANQSVLNFRATYGPKVHGAAALHAVSWHAPLRFFNVFSSIAGLMGSAGQAPHAAANSCLDAISSWRMRGGLRGQGVHWGAVAEIGYAARVGADQRAAASGYGVVSRTMAIAVLGSTLMPACRSFITLPADWSRLLAGSSEAVGFLAPLAHLRIFAPAHTAAQLPPQGTQAVAEKTLHGLEAVLELIRCMVGSFVGADVPLVEAGIDSLGAVELRHQLQSTNGTGTALPSTLVFDHPTARQLASCTTTHTATGSASSHDGLRVMASEPEKLPRDLLMNGPLGYSQKFYLRMNSHKPDVDNEMSPSVLISVRAEACSSDFLTAAVRALCSTHDILRTTYYADPTGRLCQCIIPDESFHFPVLCEDAPESSEAAKQTAVEFIRRGCDLFGAPPLRCLVMRAAARSSGFHWVALALHHVACDAACASILLNELNVMLESKCIKNRTPTVSYLEYCVWQRMQFDLEKAKIVAYWSAMREGFALPGTDGFCSPFPVDAHPERTIGLDVDYDRLRSVASALSATVPEVLYIVFSFLVHWLLRTDPQSDHVKGPIAQVTAGREDFPSMREAVGAFFYVTNLVHAFRRGRGLKEELRRVASEIIKARQYSRLTERGIFLEMMGCDCSGEDDNQLIPTFNMLDLSMAGQRPPSDMMTAYRFPDLCGEDMSWCNGKYSMLFYSFLFISESRELSFTTYGRNGAFRNAMHRLFKAVLLRVVNAAEPARCDLFDEAEHAVRDANTLPQPSPLSTA